MTRRQELYQRRADLTKEAQTLLDKATAEKREPTEEESKRFDEITAEVSGAAEVSRAADPARP